ncbi:MAG TPA: hypothetical protein VFE82_03405 [Ramlibacter sp.]|jgi:TPR repeat protein|uniref:tetratricopeptide repeat protein n=1 Tax=Ramlibacter sp. TaxID=1917967 RepID=UPI002D68E5DC|nr:hypothetical protein [Ramlibacter sp.]HZY17498.1 hypothetical protein [Ramlibacter sp.]
MISCLSRPTRLLAAGMLLAALPAFAQTLEGLSQADIEQRNAAVGFVLPQAMALSVVRHECRPFAPGEQGADAVAQRWWVRNREALDTSNAWLQRYLKHLQAADARVHRTVAASLVQASTRGMLESLRTMFHRALPDAASCAAALRRYDSPALDIAALARQPGFEQFAEFAQTLGRIRAEPGFQLPEERLRTFEVQVPSAGFGLAASLDAADKAREAGDVAGAVKAYASMVERGDARAAQTLGGLYFRGDFLPRDPAQAYRWFHKAYAMGDLAGLNGLGVLYRDGLGVDKDAPVALAAFVMASAFHRDPSEQQRARANAGALSARMTQAHQVQALCLRVSELDDALARPLGKDAPQLSRRLAEPDRRLASLLPITQPTCP